MKELEDKIEATFANGSTHAIHSYVFAEIRIGKTYKDMMPLLICPIGSQVILGIPWFNGIRANVEMGNKSFTFQSRILPNSSGVLKKTHIFPLASPKELASYNEQVRRREFVNEKAIVKPRRSQKKLTFIATIKIEELMRYRKSASIFHVDLKELEETPATVEREKMLPDDTIEDITDWSKWPSELKSLAMEFKDRFQPPTELPPERPEDIRIEFLPGSSAPKQKGITRMNEQEQVLLKESLARLIERGQIRPSISEYGSRILFVKKADGTLRLCVDYRDINAITRRNRCPIPNISELRAQVRGAQVFTKFDFRDGYHNLRVHSNSIAKTAFKCRYGLFEYTVMPFGLTNAPAAFSGMMNRIFGDLYDICVIVYLDDIVVFSNNLTDHSKHVKEVLTRFREHQLRVKLSKCRFFEKEVEFCGHIIDGEGVKVSMNKTEALKKASLILNLKEPLKNSWVSRFGFKTSSRIMHQ